MRRRPPSAQAATTRAARAEQRRTREAPRTPSSPASPWPLREVTFSFAGPILGALGVPSPRWSHPDGARLAGLLVQLGTAGSTATTVAIRLNTTTTLASVTLPPGSHRAEWEDEWGISVSTYDVLQALITTAGDGAADLTAQARFQ